MVEPFGAAGNGVYRNIGGTHVFLKLISIDPALLKLDIHNPRISYSLEQLSGEERNDAACELLLATQEDTNSLKRSIRQTRGVQEPVYVTHNFVVVEGNRRVVALRELIKEEPHNIAFSQIPAWVIPEDTPSHVIDDLINAAHLDPKRPWAPFERAIVLRRLNEAGLDSGTLAERYEMRKSEVRQFIEAANLMVKTFIPLFPDPFDPQILSRFSYFLEYVKGGCNQYRKTIADLDYKFSNWVYEGKLPKAEAVRSLPKVLECNVALDVMDKWGFKEALAALAEVDPRQDRFYGGIISLTKKLERLGTDELIELSQSPQKIEILTGLKERIELVLKITSMTTTGGVKNGDFTRRKQI